ncbi:hypothetical protein PVAP13_6KG412200 [Panicum virgatum]|uniref:Uncharacterized protein n=1 Tax=Panicum virgatum TaxID=38727 RepID=A0A8T0RI31_PANVG|nr:hypothetical protein PVAP13_6KG412200 [Panicum virgatum]
MSPSVPRPRPRWSCRLLPPRTREHGTTAASASLHTPAATSLQPPATPVALAPPPPCTCTNTLDALPLAPGRLFPSRCQSLFLNETPIPPRPVALAQPFLTCSAVCRYHQRNWTRLVAPLACPASPSSWWSRLAHSRTDCTDLTKKNSDRIPFGDLRNTTNGDR